MALVTKYVVVYIKPYKTTKNDSTSIFEAKSKEDAEETCKMLNPVPPHKPNYIVGSISYDDGE